MVFLRPPGLLAALVASLFLVPLASAQKPGALWKDVNEAEMLARLTPERAATAKRDIVPQVYRTVQLDLAGMNAVLRAAPREFTGPMQTLGVEIVLPQPYGGSSRFWVMESPIMESELAEKYPQFKTYVAQGIDDGTATARIDVTTKGFRAIVLSARGQYYIDPYWSDDTSTYISYYKRNFTANRDWTCLVHERKVDRAILEGTSTPTPNATGTQLRTYRLAVGATAEYTAAVSGTNPGTVLQALASMITTVNRVSAVYERDVAVRLVLVNNTDSLIFTDSATDGYTNGSGTTLLSENQTKCDTVIGNANYDIGHVFSTGGGGVASLGVVCATGSKARGVTGRSNPTQDPYDIDYVAHEMGHQFGGNHPFNGTTGSCSGGNRNATTAYEPGSGTTIMAYAGICSPQDLAANSDDYFHIISYNEITALVAGSASCRVLTNTGNSVPVIAALTNRTIPSQTPFALTASATDADNDTLTYCWEQFDRGAAQDPTANPRDNGASPIFRSFDPSPSPTRIFPSLTYILNNANVPPATVNTFATGEFLPTTSRTMNFRVTVRDNRAGGGGVEVGSMTVTSVAAAGPFAITSQNTAATLAGGSTQTVTWNVAGTTANGINCANVNILLSTDGGLTFPFTLASNVPNNGSASVTIPNVAQVATTQGRIKVEAVGNIFFDLNDANLTITSTNAAPTLTLNGSPNVTVQRGSASAVTQVVGTASDANGNPLSVSLANVPADATVTASINAGTISLTAQTNCSIVTTYTTRTYPMTLIVTDSIGSTTTGTVNLVVQPNPAPTIGTYTNVSVARGNTAQVTPSAAPADANGNLAPTPVTVTPTTLPGGGTVSVNAAGVVSVSPGAAATLGATTIRVTVLDICGAAQVRTFVATVQASANPLLVAGTAGAPTAESCAPSNSAVDPGEIVTIDLPVINNGSGSTTAALVGTLQTSGGVTPVGGNTQTYGVIGSGATVSRPFMFQATGTCGGTITASVQLQDGATSYGTVTYVITLGAVQQTTTTLQNFDSVTAPALPSGWVSAVASGTITNWTTSTTTPDTAPNAVFATPVTTVADLSLTSPSTAIPAGAAQVQFKHRWVFETDANGSYDGGVLEISVAGGAFTDIVTAGGSFVSGGYTATIAGGSGNPLAGRSAWTGSANTAYTTTLANLPASASGQNVQLRWRLATDSSVVPTGTVWRIDTIQLITSSRTCTTCSAAPIITSATPPSPLTVGTAYSHTFTATGSPAPTFSVFAGTLPNGITLTSGGLLSGTPTSAGTGSFPNITVRASNTGGNADQTFSLAVRTSASNYLSSFGLSGGNAAVTADPNGDGVFNLLAYALGLSPVAPSANLLPTAAIKSYAGVPYVYITFNRSSVATDLTYVVQSSPDLQTWTTIATSSGGATTSGPGFVSETGTAPTFNVEVRDTQPVDPVTGARRFLRLQVSTP
ncbi:MAG: hypothetical protein JSR82_10775 [Verrucomicrobia bacterium]|nr:hypothetical protein [Verrucomicrobiota bacterium]